MPVREKRRRRFRFAACASTHVPSQPQIAAKVRGFSPIASGFSAETDWLLEEAEFELRVPALRWRAREQGDVWG